MASINKKNLARGEDSKFQVVLVGHDRNAKGNEGYLKKGGMNFPGIKVAEKEGLKDLISNGHNGFLPNLVLIKADGTVVSNENAEVMAKLAKLAEG